MQNLQHIVGGASQILLVLLGVAFGQKNLIIGTALSLLAFMANRASSEISYQTSLRVMEEYNQKDPQKITYPAGSPGRQKPQNAGNISD